MNFHEVVSGIMIVPDRITNYYANDKPFQT
jgi:hypothetical protein